MFFLINPYDTYLLIGVSSNISSFTMLMHSPGVTLENHYSYELCTPTRGALLTGRYSMRLGLWNENLGELPLSETTLAQELQSAGYKTYMVRVTHCLLSNRPHIFVLIGIVL